MRILLVVLSVLGLALADVPPASRQEEDGGLLECVFENNSASCLRSRLSRDMDRIEFEVTGKKGEPPVSSLVEQTSNFVAELISDETNVEDADEVEGQTGVEEARRKKFGKKKKKHLQKLLGLAMLLKAKLSLLLQLISTHFQFKFFIIAIVNLILGVTKFWLDLKKSHNPAKVIYYEHAQHQHHYDHDEHDHGGYWARSSNESPQDLAYNSYAPAN
ncbi:hypothetical protein KM043_011601 [Ampulex compressa]|nr:hypothetical protein KM043_011601 [Ampulex compressa]